MHSGLVSARETQCDRRIRLRHEEARQVTPVLRLHVAGLVSRIDLGIRDDDVQEQRLGRLVADAGQVRPDPHAVVAMAMAGGACPLEHGVSTSRG